MMYQFLSEREEKKLTELMIKYYRQIMFHYRVSDDALEHIKDAFIVGYKNGLYNYLENRFDWLAEREEELNKQDRALTIRAGKLHAKEERLKKAKKEILKFNQGLLESFTIKQVACEPPKGEG